MNFFAYGTLEFPDVMETVTGRRFEAAPATLESYAREMLVGRDYPGITPRPGVQTQGVLYVEVDETAFALLDLFEDDVYDRRTVEVRTVRGAREPAHTYVIQDGHTYLLTGEPWSRTRFAAVHLRRFLDRCRRFHALAREQLAEPGP